MQKPISLINPIILHINTVGPFLREVLLQERTLGYEQGLFSKDQVNGSRSWQCRDVHHVWVVPALDPASFALAVVGEWSRVPSLFIQWSRIDPTQSRKLLSGLK